MKQTLCQRCGKQNATVTYRENINGKSRELHLCASCAAELGIVDLQENLFSFSSLSSFPLFSSHQGEASHPSQFKKSAACPLCGTTLSQIQSKGKFGCSACYDTFRDQLDLTPFVGKGYDAAEGTPAGNGVPQTSAPQDPLATLKAELKKAVAAEDYERAAKLRDEIRAKEEK